MSTTQTSIHNVGVGVGDKPSLFRRLRSLIILALVAGAGAAAWRYYPALGDAKPVADVPLYAVKKGPLSISVLESGSIRSAQAAVLKCEVEGRTTILKIVDEGVHVKTGDVLIELDSSELEDRKIDQEIRVQNSRALHVNSRENLEIIKQQVQADVSAAQLAYDFAVQDLKNYDIGDYKQDHKKIEGDITLAESQLTQARDKLSWSERLSKEGFITQTEFKSDELASKKAQLDLDLARGRLELLEKFTYVRKKAELERDCEQKKFLLAKARHRGNSNTIDAEADLLAKEAMLKREEERLGKISAQIAKCKIIAPVDGMVVYATSGHTSRSSSREPLAQGSEVREQMDLIRLPTAKEMIADVKIHESLLEKVRSGLNVRITTEALPGKVFTGLVSKIALLPDSQSIYLNPDLKVYNTEIDILDESDDLRPGMSCSADILVDQYADALYVPIQAVLRVGGSPTVYVMEAGGQSKRRPVKVGLDNNRMIHILDGLAVGEKVLLAPPLPPSTVRETQIGTSVRAPVGGGSAKPPNSSASSNKFDKDKFNQIQRDRDKIRKDKEDNRPLVPSTTKKPKKNPDDKP